MSSVVACDSINAIVVADEKGVFTFFGVSKLVPLIRVETGSTCIVVSFVVRKL